MQPLRKYRKLANLTQAQLADLVEGGVSNPQHVSRIEKLEFNMSAEWAELYSQALNSTGKVNIKPWQLMFDAEESAATVPLMGYVGAGAKICTDGIEYPADDVEAPPEYTPSTAALCVRGDSMYPAYFDGDLIYYDTQQGSTPQHFIGQHVVVKLTSNDIYIKQIANGSSPKKFNLLSFNAPPMLDVEIEWVAKIKWVKKA